MTNLFSSLAIVLLALPSYYFLGIWLGRKQALKIIVSLSIYALAVETFALLTGYPYGEFIYLDKIGYRLFGLTPWTVPFAWVPLLIGSSALASRFSTKALTTIIWSTLFLTLADAVIDPAAVALGFWQYGIFGNYYDVPLSNFGGWLISGFIASVIFYALLPKSKRHARFPLTLMLSLLLVLTFWTAVCFWLKFAYPFWIGVIYCCFCCYLFFKDRKTVPNMIK